MKSRPVPDSKHKELRRRAVKKISGGDATDSAAAMDLRAALEELRVHSVELEIQNEELQHSRRQLEESQKRYFRHFDLAPIGMIRLNQKGAILEANILGAKMIGIDRSRLKSNKINFAAFVSPESVGTFHSHLKGTLTSLKMESCELSLRDKAPGESFVQMQSVCSAGPNDTVDLLVTLTDLTKQKLAEAGRLDLEHKLLDRQKLENIGTLAGGIAHDLNNILQIIIANLDLLTAQPVVDDAEGPYMHDAREAAKRATGLSRRLLTFSKGRSSVKQTLDVREIVASAVLLSVSGSTLRPFLSIRPHLHPITVDPVQLAQVIENVVINAREATVGGGKLFVRARNVDLRSHHLSGLPPGQYVRIEIEDRGVGIPEDIRERIFEICFTTKSGGSGIGLATAKSILLQHGGSIEITSTVGHGTIVSVYLPAAKNEVIAAVPSQPDAIVRGSGRILIIDDEEMILSVVPLMLKGLGYEGAVAKEGGEGCDIYRHAKAEGKSFAAVLLDGTIPDGLGGEAALRRLLAIDPDACVILCSGYVDHDLFGQAGQLGFKGCLAKPFGIRELGSALRNVLSPTPQPPR
jgi:signal transduction histidine kinase/CheY-like chemotaxis protein